VIVDYFFEIKFPISGVYMLIKFSVENYKSFDKKNELNFLASADTNQEDMLLSAPLINSRILPSLCIYGANEAGKSNLLAAFNTAIFIIKNSLRFQEGDKIPYSPFKLNDSNNKRTSYEFVFICSGVRYYYGFSHNKYEILEEYLYHYPNGRQSIIFEREKNNFNFKRDKEELITLSKRTIKNRLFISTAAEWNYHKVKNPFRFLKSNFIFNNNFDKDNRNWSRFTFIQIETNLEFKKQVLSILKDINSDIIDIVVHSQKKVIEEKDLPVNVPENIKQLMLNKSMGISHVQTIHKGYDRYGNEVSVPFNLNEESKGINKFLEFIGPCLDILKNGKCLLIDEIETSFHPLIVKYLIKMFLDNTINTNGAQLIFSTHDSNLLDLKFFRRDQIWFVEKDEKSSSDLYSLSDLKGIRKDENIKKGYLRGKYGGIPFLSNQLDEI